MAPPRPHSVLDPPRERRLDTHAPKLQKTGRLRKKTRQTNHTSYDNPSTLCPIHPFSRRLCTQRSSVDSTRLVPSRHRALLRTTTTAAIFSSGGVLTRLRPKTRYLFKSESFSFCVKKSVQQLTKKDKNQQPTPERLCRATLCFMTAMQSSTTRWDALVFFLSRPTNTFCAPMAAACPEWHFSAAARRPTVVAFLMFSLAFSYPISLTLASVDHNGLGCGATNTNAARPPVTEPTRFGCGNGATSERKGIRSAACCPQLRPRVVYHLHVLFLRAAPLGPLDVSCDAPTTNN